MLCIEADGILATTDDGMRSDEVLATAVAMIRAERRIFWRLPKLRKTELA